MKAAYFGLIPVLLTYVFTVTAAEYPNIALGKEVTGHIGTGAKNTLPNLVDGDDTTMADSGTEIKNPAFVIDLGKSFDVVKIRMKIPTMAECRASVSGEGCGYQKTSVIVGDYPDPTDERNTVCFTMDMSGTDANGKTIERQCRSGRMVGRYVSIRKGNTIKRAMALKELSVYGIENIAYKEQVTSIASTGGEATYPKLADGNPFTCADSGALAKDPAFVIDLGKPHLVDQVYLKFPLDCDWTQTKAGCSYRNTYIKVGNSPNPSENSDCVYMDEKPADVNGKERIFTCTNGPLLGRYVSLTKYNINFDRTIALCSMNVYGEEAAPEPPTKAPTEPPMIPTEVASTVIPTLPPCEYPVPIENVAHGKSATQSSIKKGSDETADKAVDGSKATCSTTKKEYEASWVVDLGEPKDIYEIAIYTDQDKPHLVKPGVVRVGQDENFDNNPQCGMQILGSMAKQYPVIVRCGCKTPMRGRYVSVRLADKNRSLRMCEVEVRAG